MGAAVREVQGPARPEPGAPVGDVVLVAGLVVVLRVLQPGSPGWQGSPTRSLPGGRAGQRGEGHKRACETASEVGNCARAVGGWNGTPRRREPASRLAFP